MLDWKKSQNTQNRYFRAIDRTDEDSLANIETDIIDENIDHLGLGRLPQSQREAVEMRYLEDMSFDDIARRLGTTSINARQLVNRGLKKIRKFFLSKERRKV